MKVEFTLSIGFVTACRKEVVELDDEAMDEEIDEEYAARTGNFIDGGWKKL